MRREWSCALFDSSLEDDEAAASCLAAVSEPRFLATLKLTIESLSNNGEKLCIATDRNKYDAEGNVVTGDEDAAGQFKTDGYVFTTAEEETPVAAAPEHHGCGISHMLAYELAAPLSPDIVRSVLDLKVFLDRAGGQAWIAPYVQAEQVIGYIFVWDHISKLGRGKEPDAKIEEPLPLVVKGE